MPFYNLLTKQTWSVTTLLHRGKDPNSHCSQYINKASVVVNIWRCGNLSVCAEMDKRVVHPIPDTHFDLCVKPLSEWWFKIINLYFRAKFLTWWPEHFSVICSCPRTTCSLCYQTPDSLLLPPVFPVSNVPRYTFPHSSLCHLLTSFSSSRFSIWFTSFLRLLLDQTKLSWRLSWSDKYAKYIPASKISIIHPKDDWAGRDLWAVWHLNFSWWELTGDFVRCLSIHPSVKNHSDGLKHWF